MASLITGRRAACRQGPRPLPQWLLAGAGLHDRPWLWRLLPADGLRAVRLHNGMWLGCTDGRWLSL